LLLIQVNDIVIVGFGCTVRSDVHIGCSNYVNYLLLCEINSH